MTDLYHLEWLTVRGFKCLWDCLNYMKFIYICFSSLLRFWDFEALLISLHIFLG